MTHLWRLLSGDIPGGFAILLVTLAAFWVVWEFVYRASETLPAKTYRKWRLFGPLIIIAIYAILWVQSPPKVEPIRVAILTRENHLRATWQSLAISDLAARCLRNTLNKSIINPWEDATDYQVPNRAAAERAGYVTYEVNTTAEAAADVWSNGLKAAQGAMKVLRINRPLKPPFPHQPTVVVLESYYKGRDKLTSGRPDSASFYFQTALAVDSSFFPAKIGLAHCRELAGDRAGAQNLMLEAARADTGSTEAMLALGEFFLRIYEWNGAESAFKVVLARDPLQTRAMLGLTHIHPDRLKDLQLNTVMDLAEEAVRLDPAYDQARVVYAEQLAQKGYLGQARTILEQGLKINPESQDLHLKLGAIEIQGGNPEAARSIYEDMLKENPSDALAAFNLGVVQYHAKQYDQAAETFRQVQSLNGPVDCLYYLGMICKIKGDTVKARSYFSQRWEKRTGEADEFGQRAARMVALIDQETGGGK